MNHYHIYAVDRDFGPFFLKFSSYFPRNSKLRLNGDEYAKQQFARKGIAFEALENGIQSCADPQCLQAICGGLSGGQDRRPAAQVAAPPAASLHRRRPAGRLSLRRLHPARRVPRLPEMLDRPVHGRLFFEPVIRENLAILGRPDQVQLIFDRRIIRTTRGRFRTCGPDPGGHAVAAHRLQAHAHQAVS